jgi:hypothetical protein
MGPDSLGIERTPSSKVIKLFYVFHKSDIRRCSILGLKGIRLGNRMFNLSPDVKVYFQTPGSPLFGHVTRPISNFPTDVVR